MKRSTHVSEFVLVSTGPASSYQGSALGVYSSLPEEPGLYKQKGGDYFMHKDGEVWYVSPRLTNCNKTYKLGYVATWVASIKTNNLRGVGTDWSYGKAVSGRMTTQPCNLFQSPTQLLAASCSSIIIISTNEEKSDNYGVFRAVMGKYSAGRPVYRNDAGQFLMVKNEFTSFSVWDDADKRLHAGKGDEGERIIHSGSAPTCVTDLDWMADQVRAGLRMTPSGLCVRIVGTLYACPSSPICLEYKFDEFCLFCILSVGGIL
jgi:hypothetical protein